jgi:hypothetical protein
MNKKDTLKRFIEELPYRQVIQVHNSFCSRVHSEKHIYGIDELWIQSQFPTSIDLYKAIKYKGFDPTKSLCWIDLDGKYHHTGILDIIDLDAVVEHLINWGDAGYNFACDIEHALLDGLVTWCLDQVSDRYNEVEVRTKLEECDFDFLMDDWDDILKDVFDVVGVCPNCGNIIYQDNPHEYQYETGKTIYECNHCDRVLD